MAENIERELSWDDEISQESEYRLLPEGDYNFYVRSFKRTRHPGSAKLPPCAKAELEIELTDDNGNKGVVFHNLFLHTKTEGMLSAFFIAIGQKKHGEALKPNWQAVLGSNGKCKVGIHKWINDRGEERENNQIAKFYEPEDKPAFTPGAF